MKYCNKLIYIVLLLSMLQIILNCSNEHSDKTTDRSGKHEHTHADVGKSGDHTLILTEEKQNGHSEETHKEDEHEDEHGDEHSVNEFGPGKGIELYEPEHGIVLGDLAYKRLQIGLTSFNKLKQKDNNWIVPSSALITEENDTGIYIKQGKWYKFMPVKVITKGKHSIQIHIFQSVKGVAHKVGASNGHTKFHVGKADAIVTKSAPLLRLAELNAAGASGEGHGH